MEYTIIIFLFALTIQETSFKMTTTTLKPKERIRALRQKINKVIISTRTKDLYAKDEKDTALEDYEYVDNEKLPITPVMDFDPKRLDEKFKLRSIKNKKSNVRFDSHKTTAKLQNTTDNDKNINTNALNTTDNINMNFNKSKLHLRKQKRTRVKKPLEIFYRRLFNHDMLQDKVEWVHCQDMITPLLTGAKTNISNPKRLQHNDPVVLRFLQLLNLNTTSYNRDDIYSILYQISNLQLRLFQWDIVPLNLLLNIVSKEKIHSFRNLKYGIRNLFNNWRLDFTNTSSLLSQARIFRPPCVQVSKLDGSTKSPKIIKYTKKDQQTTTPCDDDEDC